ncbi:MAG: hypothetical protein AAB213_03505 [Candidatus Omnitrophota bacterium]
MREIRQRILAGTNISLPLTVSFITWVGYNMGIKVFWTCKIWRLRPNRAVSCILALIPVIFSFGFAGSGRCASSHQGEKIIYAISPVGRAEYNDLGTAVLEGHTVRLCTFKTRAMGFDDTEKIYSDPESGMPLRVERNISYWLSKEHIVEEYDQKNFILTVTKSVKGKKQERVVFKGDGPIHNAILLPFSLRQVSDLKVGWTATVRFPLKFEVRLDSMREIETSAGKFRTYHFTSNPNKFEIWISQDALRLPLKIKGAGGLGYTLIMGSYKKGSGILDGK